VKVFVLGHRGMLGHAVARYFRERGHDVQTTDLRYDGGPQDPLVEAVRASGCEWVVNGIARIHQKRATAEDMQLVNARLPMQLKNRLLPRQRLLHASTDGVFSGRRGGYRVQDECDAQDPYGLSKIAGEAAAQAGRCVALRASVIGPELCGASSLMAWYMSQRQPAQGYSNHRWNGITTLEWAKLALEIMQEHSTAAPVVQAACAAPLSKYELLCAIRATWPECAPVRAVDAPDAVDRTLVAQLVRAPIAEQLAELRGWYGKAP
jgi:dTDP-4-dehydrorhamnose reductase